MLVEGEPGDVPGEGEGVDGEGEGAGGVATLSQLFPSLPESHTQLSIAVHTPCALQTVGSVAVTPKQVAMV